MQSNIGTNKRKTNTCTGTLNDTNYHKKLSYDMCSVYQMATLHYYTQTKLLLWTLFTVTTGFPSSMSSAWSVYQAVDQVGTFIQSPSSFQVTNSSAILQFQILLGLEIVIWKQ